MGRLFKGWDQIAEWLQVSTKHAQRLRRRYGLPVYKSEGYFLRGKVFAHEAELWEWVKNTSCAEKKGAEINRKKKRLERSQIDGFS
jgi:hypothetical protein